MDLMRHSDVNLTMRLYSHTVIADRASALDSLPLIATSDVQLAATGTDRSARRALINLLRTWRITWRKPAGASRLRWTWVDRNAARVIARKCLRRLKKHLRLRELRQSHRGDSNPQPAVYKTAALPIELRWRRRPGSRALSLRRAASRFYRASRPWPIPAVERFRTVELAGAWSGCRRRRETGTLAGDAFVKESRFVLWHAVPDAVAYRNGGGPDWLAVTGKN